jgi:gliding motility-associated-like protein
MKFINALSISFKNKLKYITFFLISGILLNAYSNLSSSKLFNFFAAPTATISVSKPEVCKNETTIITYTGSEGTAPYTFTYTENGTEKTKVTSATDDSISFNFSSATPDDYVFILTKVKDSSEEPIVDNLNETATIKVTAPPIADFNFNNNNLCSGETITFTNNSTGTGTLTYLWNFGDGVTSNRTAPTHKFEALGCGTKNFNVSLTVTDKNGCSASKTEIVSVKERPDILIFDLNDRDFSNCNRTSSEPNYIINVGLDASTSNCINSFLIIWGDGNQENVTRASFPLTHEYKELGVYDLIVRSNSSNGCANEIKKEVKNISNPSGSLVNPGSTQNVCTPTNSIEFSISKWGVNSLDTRYFINYGDGSTISLTQFELINSDLNLFNSSDPENSPNFPVPHIYEKSSCPNTFTASLDVINACSSTKSFLTEIRILDKPKLDFEIPEFACANNSISFQNKSVYGFGSNCSESGRFTWNFGDGTSTASSAELSSPNHIYDTPGNYTITLSATSFCGPIEITKQICIEPEITPTFSVDKETGCIPFNLSTTNTTDETALCSDATYVWSVNYTSDNCGSSEDWEFRNNTDKNSENPKFIFNNPGKYTLTQRITTGCGTKTNTKIIDVKKPPTAVIQEINDVCGSITFTPTATVENCTSNTTGISYNWTFTGGTPANSTSLDPGAISYTNPGVYEVTFTINSECGDSNIAKQSFEIFEKPVITNTNSTQEICSGQNTSAINLTASVGATYTWDAIATGGITGFIASGNSDIIPSQKIINSGNKQETVTYTVTPSGNSCIGEPFVFTITVNPAPIIIQQPTSSEICLDGAATLLEVKYENGTGTPNYQWFSNTENNTTNGNLIADATAASYNPPTDSVGEIYYYAEITFSSGGCSKITSDIASVIVNEIPIIASHEITIYSLQNFIFNPSSVSGNTIPLGTKYTWNTPTINPASSILGTTNSIIPANEINQTLENTGTTSATVTYIITPATAACTGDSFTLKVTVNATINPNAIVTNNNCFESNDGTILTNITGGIPFNTGTPYLISWTGPNGFSSNETNISNLETGVYTLRIEDKEGYFISQEFTITQPNLLSITSNLEKDISCFQGNDGAIDVTISGGTMPYSYNWSTTDGNGIVENSINQNTLTAGTYTLAVTDTNNCTTFSNYTLTEPQGLQITITSKIDVLCFGNATGSIAISVLGGTPLEISPGVFDYVYSWSGPNNFTSTSKDINSLIAGAYEVAVTDNLGCTTSASFVVNESPEININFSKIDVTCYGETNGSIDVTVNGGAAPYQISWSNFANGFSLNNLSAGTYIATITIVQPIFFINPTVTPISCNGETDGTIDLNLTGGIAPISVVWDDDASAGIQRNNLGPGTYRVVIIDSDTFQCPIEQTFTFINPPALAVSIFVLDAIDCDIVNSGSINLDVSGGTMPYSFKWNTAATTEDLNNIPPGDYAVEITDGNGCTITRQFNIFRQEPLHIAFETTLLADCDVKIVSQQTVAKGTGGFLPYSYSWSAGTPSNTDNSIMTTAQNGSYTLTITDAKGCTKSASFLVNVPSIGNPEYKYDSFSFTSYNFNSIQDPIQFTNLSTGEYDSLSWDFGDGSLPSKEENPIHTYDQTGTFNVVLTVVYDAGCIETFDRTIEITKGYLLLLPNAFTPNGDGHNETIRPVYRGFTEIQMAIYDTWGTQVYSEDGLNLKGWDGLIRGKPAENGNYVMFVKGITFYQKEISESSPVTLLK